MEATEHAALVTLRGRHAHIEPRLEAVEAAARIVRSWSATQYCRKKMTREGSPD